MEAIGFALLVVLVLFLLAQDYHLMSALEIAHPKLYRRYGGHSFVFGFRRFWMLVFFIGLGGYRSEISDPEGYARAARYRAAWLSYLCVLSVFLAWIFLRQ